MTQDQKRWQCSVKTKSGSGPFESRCVGSDSGTRWAKVQRWPLAGRAREGTARLKLAVEWGWIFKRMRGGGRGTAS